MSARERWTANRYAAHFAPWVPWSQVFKSLDKLRDDAMQQAAAVGALNVANSSWRDLAHTYAWNMVRMQSRVEAEHHARLDRRHPK